MIVFDQLRVSDDGKRLYINVHVNTTKYFENVYLDNITVMTATKKDSCNNDVINVSESNPECPTDDYIYRIEFQDNLKEAAIVLNKGVLDGAFTNTNTDGSTANVPFCSNDFSSDLFFVCVKTRRVGDTPIDPCIPCRFDEEHTLGVTLDESVLYQRVMDYTKSLASDCNIPQDFVDFILLWNAFKASIETEHYVAAVDFYKKLFGKGKFNSPYGSKSYVRTKGCGCHG